MMAQPAPPAKSPTNPKALLSSGEYEITLDIQLPLDFTHVL